MITLFLTLKTIKMKQLIKISINFKDFENFTICNRPIVDFQSAIKIVRLLELSNVRLIQGNEDWDNF